MALTTIKTGGLTDNSVTDAKVADAITVTGAQTGITQVGTLTAGTWNGTAIASAYLDADTAHLSTAQTFSGAKTFTDGVHFKGSAWNDIMIIGDTSRSNEEETHIRNGEVNFSISVNDGTYSAFSANHDGSAMTLGGDFGSGTLTVTPPTTFAGFLNDTKIYNHLKFVASDGTTVHGGVRGASNSVEIRTGASSTVACTFTSSLTTFVTDLKLSDDLYFNGGGNDAWIIGKTNGSGYLRIQNFAEFKVDGHVIMNDSKELRLGNNADLLLYHNGSNSYLDHYNTGELYIRNRRTSGDILIATRASNGDNVPCVTFNSAGSSTFDGNIASENFSSETAFGGDVDTLKRAGFYRIENSASNMITGNYYSMIVAGNGSNVTSQWAVDLLGGQTYTRSFNTSWTSWVRIDD